MHLQSQRQNPLAASVNPLAGSREALLETPALSRVPAAAIAETPATPPAKRESRLAQPTRAERISQAIQELVYLLPSKPAAVGLENGLIALVLGLDADTQRLALPFLESECDYQPFVPPPTDAGPPLNAHLLIVEDAYVSRLVLRRVIEQLPGCTVTEAVNGAEALELLQKGLKPDVIVSDIFMPEMDGLELLGHIRSNPHLADLEVVMCTSTTDQDSVLRAAELNVTKYLVKPFKPEDVRNQLRDILTEAAIRAQKWVEDLQEKLGLSPGACADLFEQLAGQFEEDIKNARAEIAAGKTPVAVETLQSLRGACSQIKDAKLVARVQSVINDTNQNDVVAIAKGFEVLEADGKRLSTMVARLRQHHQPAQERTDPLTAAAQKLTA